MGRGAGAVESATARATRLGAQGEQAVGLFGPKVGIRIPGANNLRFPDGITMTTLTEVKNVQYQGLTNQLRDYVTYSQKNKLTFDLYVRGPLYPTGQTILTGPLEAAVKAGTIRLKFIPGTF
jgi:Restriction endonuclease fold toxin 7